MYGWPVLGLALQSRGEGGLPSTRGDDKLLMYLVHNVEDEIVFLDIQDLLDGTYTAIGRYAGSRGVPFPRHLFGTWSSKCVSIACCVQAAGGWLLPAVCGASWVPHHGESVQCAGARDGALAACVGVSAVGSLQITHARKHCLCVALLP